MIYIYILFKKLLCSTCLLTKDRKIHFLMLHHEESPEKPQYNMVTPPLPILPYPPFPSKNFRPPPIFINFEKVEPPTSNHEIP